jgi:hypothetical protein
MRWNDSFLLLAAIAPTALLVTLRTARLFPSMGIARSRSVTLSSFRGSLYRWNCALLASLDLQNQVVNGSDRAAVTLLTAKTHQT